MNAVTKRSLLVVDDHPIVRHGIVQLINREPDLECTGEADDAEAAMQILRERDFDLVIVDISLPGLSGLDLARRIKAFKPDLPMLVLSMHEEAVYADRALEAGVRGFLMKQEATDKLVDAVRKLLSGGIYLSRDLEERMFRSFVGGQEGGAVRAGSLARLNERELEVLQLIAQGLTSAQIASRINRSIKSVEAYRASIRGKLGARSTVDLARIALEYFAASPRSASH